MPGTTLTRVIFSGTTGIYAADKVCVIYVVGKFVGLALFIHV